MRITRDRGGGRVTAAEMIAIDPVRGPRWSTSGRDQRVQPVLLHDGVNSLRAREQVVLAQCLQVRFAGERSFLLRLFHDVLAEVRHLASTILFVEGDHVFE